MCMSHKTTLQQCNYIASTVASSKSRKRVSLMHVPCQGQAGSCYASRCIDQQMPCSPKCISCSALRFNDAHELMFLRASCNFQPPLTRHTVCHVVNFSLDYSRAITASADLLNIYIFFSYGSAYIRATQLQWCHLDAPSVRNSANVTSGFGALF